VRAAAQVVRDAGDVVIIWGERVLAGGRGANAGQGLLAVADALGVAGKPESGLIGIPAETNGRGLREVGCVGGMGPGFSEADTPSGDVGGALLLLEADADEADMAAASGVVAFAQFPTEALAGQADVVFPAQVYAEKEGTVTHPDGRVQRVRQALGLPGTARPGWQVLAELCDLLGADTGARSSSAVTALIADSVPFYAGLTLDEVGGDGVRWQDREAAPAAPADELPTAELEQPPPVPDGLVLGSAPTLWIGPSVEHSPSLRFLDTAPRLLVSPADARELGVESGDEVELEANGDGTRATVVIRTGVPSRSVFLSPPALAEGPVRISAREAVPG
jgi:NADH-quinone oxidoreductase subunit G